MIAHVLQLLRDHAWNVVRQFTVLVTWALIYMALLLGAFAGLIKFSSGWDAVVLTSGSMSPALRAGDVLFTEAHPDELLGQKTVVTFRPDGGGDLVTHRVFETLIADRAYVTKGDANPTPDSDHVSPAQVVGVGRLVVPYLGLPVVWAERGDYVALGGLAVVVAAAITALVANAGRRRESSLDDSERFSSTAQRGIARARLIVALMISMQIATGDRQFQLDAVGLGRASTLLIALGALGAVSLFGRYRASGSSQTDLRRLALMELAGDTLVVVFFVTASGSSGIGWILMALPIIEAAIYFRLTGAFVQWMLMSGLILVMFFSVQMSAGAPQSVILEDLNQLVDRLGVLLLVVIPGSYLAEQLLGDVLAQREATGRASERSRLIERVTEAGREVTRIGGDLFESLVDASLDMGFDGADAWVGGSDRAWQLLAVGGTTPLPPAGAPASGLRVDDLAWSEVFVDGHDEDDDEVAALAACGAAMVIRLTLSCQDGMYIVLRVGASDLGDDPSSRVMALRLLSGQASVALQNEQLIGELRQTHDELERQAMFDALTGLPNRPQFMDRVNEALRRTAGGAQTISVLFLDLNGFKAVNDRLGHGAGDDLLVQVAGRISSAVGPRGLVARLGGDEFTVLMADGSIPIEAEETADAIHLALSDPFELAGEHAKVGTSVGIAHSEPAIAVDEMLRRADVAMYAAKSSNAEWRTLTYDVRIDEDERRTERLAGDLAAALASGEVSLVYQPIVETATDRIAGAEALIRWRHPQLGAIPAPVILAAAELGGRVDMLNRWILDTALGALAGVPTAGAAPFIAVNATPRELLLPTLVDNVADAIAAHGIDPSRVVIELNERMVVEQRDANDNIVRLRELGVEFALDDFGQGQTSLAHLRGLPIGYLKLDRLLVQQAAESAADDTILGSVVHLAHNLGLSVIAEGVEHSEHRDVVAAVGADLIQGYGVHVPMSIRELTELLRSGPSNRIAVAAPPVRVSAAPPNDIEQVA